MYQHSRFHQTAAQREPDNANGPRCTRVQKEERERGAAACAIVSQKAPWLVGAGALAGIAFLLPFVQCGRVRHSRCIFFSKGVNRGSERRLSQSGIDFNWRILQSRSA